MYRCAGRSVLVFENRDSFSMRIATKLGFVPVHEFQAVVANDYEFGGYRNTGVPNAVYRWTEREVSKILDSFDPAYDVPVRFFYGLRLPHVRIQMIRNKLLRTVFQASFKPFEFFAYLFPTQMNEFAFFIDKSARRLQPWMEANANGMNREFWAKGQWKEPIY